MPTHEVTESFRYNLTSVPSVYINLKHTSGKYRQICSHIKCEQNNDDNKPTLSACVSQFSVCINWNV